MAAKYTIVCGRDENATFRLSMLWRGLLLFFQENVCFSYSFFYYTAVRIKNSIEHEKNKGSCVLGSLALLLGKIADLS